MKSSKTELENELFKSVEDKTPCYIKKRNLINLSNEKEFTFILKKEHLEAYDSVKNPEGLNLNEWLENYEKEAKVSTAGIRGPQNILYPQDTRFPINLIGVILATLAKSLVANGKYKGIIKIAGREVRYNSELYLDAISRIQAAQGIRTLLPKNKKTIPIWLASFLAFKLDLLGGEYITSSHGISVKNATKDLNSQGSQYLPEESMEFVEKIKEIFKITEQVGQYIIKFSKSDDKFIDDKTLTKFDDGIDLYVDYLKTGVADSKNIKLINELNGKIIIENVGGSAYRTLSRILKKLDISEKYDWFNKNEDPFFNGIGKYSYTPTGEKVFYDYSVDVGVTALTPDGKKFFPVIDTMHYDEKLKEYPDGTVVLITDPDHDRLTVTQKENKAAIPKLEKIGIDYINLNKDSILTIYTANQAFLMLMDFRVKQLKMQDLWNNHPRFIIKTTASARSWDEWAKKQGVNVINVPVGFKEIANIMKKVELKLKQFPDKDIIIDDVFGNPINLGKNPRLLFAGEESGGMIMGPEDLIKSFAGREAIAMREKSASEAIIVASALISSLNRNGKMLSENLERVFNGIAGKYDTRVDIAYYNESEPDINKLKAAKIEGEEQRSRNDLYYLSMAIAVSEGQMTVEDVKYVLNKTFPDLSFENLKSVRFVGDGTYFEFVDKFIEIRPSGTDAKTKAYGGGNNRQDIEFFADKLGHYSGERTTAHKEFISDEYYNSSREKSLEYYMEFVKKDANNEPFKIPDYEWI